MTPPDTSGVTVLACSALSGRNPLLPPDSIVGRVSFMLPPRVEGVAPLRKAGQAPLKAAGQAITPLRSIALNGGHGNHAPTVYRLEWRAWEPCPYSLSP